MLAPTGLDEMMIRSNPSVQGVDRDWPLDVDSRRDAMPE
jgi:hypothetical protein